MKLSYITLICKNDNIPYLCKNYRPISLLNVDYKIITKILSTRLRVFLPSLIHQDQTCSVKGRSIQDNCHYLRDIMNSINEDNTQGLVLSLDQEKAFDRVDHSYLHNILKMYGFDDKFLTWIKILYKEISSSVIVNNHISDSFNITRSVRQGCPLSPLLYVLALEPVLSKIRKDPLILGCPIPGNRVNPPKLTAFADDCKFVVKTHESVEEIFKHFKDYSKLSGAKINKGKTEIKYLGKWKERESNHLNIKVVKEMTVFGITFGNTNKNWKDIIATIRNKLNFYTKRKLSYLGKAKLCNLLILPQFWYIATIFPPPTNVLKSIEQIIYEFMWDKGKDKVNRKTMILPASNGGVGLVNIKLKYYSLFLNQMIKVFNNHDTPWVNFGHQHLGIILRKYNGYNFDNCSYPHRLTVDNSFYNEIKKALTVLEKAYPDFTITKDLNSKTFYKLLMEAEQITPKCISKRPLMNYKEIFKNMDNNLIDYLAFNTTFLAAHGVLPVAANLHKWNIYKSPYCKNCHQCPETEEHVFLHCAQNHLSKHWLLNLVYKTFDYALENNDILFGIDKNITTKSK